MATPIKRYKAKPVVIAAAQFTGKNGRDIVDWAKSFPEAFKITPIKNGGSYLKIVTLEGIMKATKGWYIVQGLEGEFYPVAPDIFKKKYELIKE